MLPRNRVGNNQESEFTRNSPRNVRPQSCQIPELLQTDTGLNVELLHASYLKIINIIHHFYIALFSN